MREILFRGKGAINGYWVYGDYVNNGTKHYIYTKHEHGEYGWYEIEPKSLGQFTGLTDKNGNKIFEDDIVKINGWWNASGSAGYTKNLTVVEFIEEICGFTPMCIYDSDCGVYHDAKDTEVIGNIYDNPELLGGAK